MLFAFESRGRRLALNDSVFDIAREPEDWLPMSELLLMNAARHDLVERVIKPRLVMENGVG